ncbi:MAG: SUMF1/EgtB/PvdO family nonheme iron enzyme, partial [Myxococcales bacterium]|nr:SUMF1/EgtB/PvdO family nonheme iron enzyme [Myxococcales bacterium]
MLIHRNTVCWIALTLLTGGCSPPKTVHADGEADTIAPAPTEGPVQGDSQLSEGADDESGTPAEGTASEPAEGHGAVLQEPADSEPEPPDDMLAVPGGTFTMGADSGGEQDERPAHQVTVSGFWLDRTEVTNAAYSECVEAGVCREKSSDVSRRYPHFNGANQPVSGVS